MESIRHKKIVFIFDECHRSQFGDTHQRIISFFTNKQMFGFTGTPIFTENNRIIREVDLDIPENQVNTHSRDKSEDSDIVTEFDNFMLREKNESLIVLCHEEGVNIEKFQEILSDYLYTGKTPLDNAIVGTLHLRPKLKDRKPLVERIISKLKEFVEKFDS